MQEVSKDSRLYNNLEYFSSYFHLSNVNFP
jgi:hypothetical protein